MSKTLVLFVFHEYNIRINSFINKCIFYDENVDFVMICNNKNIIFNVPDYVTKIFRDNIGYDFGGWSEALLTNNSYQKYEHFIFVNSSVVGPFVPSFYKDKWTNIYIGGLINNVKLFGSTINTCGDPLHKSHVQSYIFAMNKITLEYLIKCEIFSMTNYAKTFDEAIWNKEVLMSRKIIENGWNIGSLLRYYNNVDFTFSNKSPSDYRIKFLDEVVDNSHYNKLWTLNQVVFTKGNRNIKF